MKKANATTKALLLSTLLFTAIAALSFVSFQETQSLCNSAKKGCQATPPRHSGGQMVWDDFSRRFLSFISLK